MRSVREEGNDLIELGTEAYRARLTTPVLVELAVQAQEGEEEFLTKPLTKPLMRATIEDQDALSARPRVGSEARVHFVRKRPNGAFPDRIGVGRTGTDIVLAYPLISKYHAYFRCDGHEWFLTDAGSRNGSFVAGERLARNETRRLGDRTELRLGPYGLRFYMPDAFIAFLSAR